MDHQRDRHVSTTNKVSLLCAPFHLSVSNCMSVCQSQIEYQTVMWLTGYSCGKQLSHILVFPEIRVRLARVSWMFHIGLAQPSRLK